MKSKRKLVLAKQHEIIGLFRTDIEQILLSFEDNARSILNYHLNRYFLFHKLTSYIQPTEEFLASQKSKFLNRVTGFTKEIIDSLYEEKITEKTLNNNLFNAIVFKLQEASRNLVSNHILPDMLSLKELFVERHYDDLGGGILEGFGRLLKFQLKIYV